MKKYIALVDNVDSISHAKVTTTAWDREIGDRVNELGVRMTVVAVGTDRNEVVRELNVLIDARNQVVRAENKKRKVEAARRAATRELTEGEKQLLGYIKDLNDFRNRGL